MYKGHPQVPKEFIIQFGESISKHFVAPHRAHTPRLLLRAFSPQVCYKLMFNEQMGRKEGGKEGRRKKGKGRGEREGRKE